MNEFTLIRSLRELRGITQEHLAKKVGVSRVSVSKWESGENKPKGDNLFALAAALGVEPRILLLDEAHLGLAPGTEALKQWLAGEGFKVAASAVPFSNVTPAVADTRRVPVFSYVQAGMWMPPREIRDFDGGIEHVSTDEDVGDRAFAMRIQGDSMAPDFSEGDLVIIDPEVTALPGDFVVAKNGSDEATFKKYRPRGYKTDGSEIFELVPLNDDYPILSSEVCAIHIIGTMVEHRKFRRRKR